jgi:hypothetical protein
MADAEARRSPLNVQRMVGWDKLAKVLELDFLRQQGKRLQRHVPQPRLYPDAGRSTHPAS